MSTDASLFVPVCSVTLTKRRRFFWACWWSGPPTRVPFRKPDASDGGAPTHAAAVEAATRAAGMAVTLGPSTWAKAWMRTLRGQRPWPDTTPHDPEGPPDAPPGPTEISIWDELRVAPSADDAALKLAFRQRALQTHPDHGGSDEAFRRVVRAYAEARRRRARPRRRS